MEWIMSRRTRDEFGVLQENVRELGGSRTTALRLFVASRYAATALAQREFWLEFVWADQEYRVAVRRLAQFCAAHTAAMAVERR
jgi:hypothetical protein